MTRVVMPAMSPGRQQSWHALMDLHAMNPHLLQ